MELNVEEKKIDSTVAMPKIVTQEKERGCMVADGREVSHIVSQLCRDEHTLELTNYIILYRLFLGYCLEEGSRKNKSLVTNGVVLDVKIALWSQN